jgi:hypothetical protein
MRKYSMLPEFILFMFFKPIQASLAILLGEPAAETKRREVCNHAVQGDCG